MDDKHRGEVVERVVRKSGFSIRILAERLSVSRNTIYNKFKEHDLSYDSILKVGEVIKYDFSLDFPEIRNTISLNKNRHVTDLWKLEHKYTLVLEHYSTLLTFLIKIANDYNIEKLKKDIDNFLNNNATYISHK